MFDRLVVFTFESIKEVNPLAFIGCSFVKVRRLVYISHAWYYKDLEFRKVINQLSVLNLTLESQLAFHFEEKNGSRQLK